MYRNALTDRRCTYVSVPMLNMHNYLVIIHLPYSLLVQIWLYMQLYRLYNKQYESVQVKELPIHLVKGKFIIMRLLTKS